jgi:hypothetical protein
MTIVANTLLTYASVGNREDLAPTIYNISPTDTPFLGMVNSNKATATKHEWQTDSLASAAANAQLEGDDFTYGAVSATSRVSNYCQISSKTTVVSGTQDAVSKSGRNKEMIYQLMKRGKELKRDMEFALLNNQTPVGSSANSATARALASLTSWYTTNVQRGVSGANATQAAGTPTTGATDGTQRALNEGYVKAGLQAAWTAGGDVDLIMCGPFNKTVISSFAGNITRTDNNSEDKKLNTAIDIYVSDFGSHKIVANRFSRDRDLHLLTTDLFAVSYLRPMKTIDLAQTGDAVKGAIIAEFTLECRNQSGSAIVADLTTS